MKLIKEKKESLSDLSGSMTDICFLLIIFFLVAAVFINDEGLVLFLPSEDAEPQKKTEEKLLQMQLLQEDTIIINKKPYPLDQFKSVILSFMQDKRASTCILELGENISYRKVMQVISITQRAGIEDFTIFSSELESFLIPINFSSNDSGYVKTNFDTSNKDTTQQ